MLTKALIKELPAEGSNIFKIRVPLFEDNTNTEVVYDALYCYTPGIFGGLNVNDCVYVAFEDDKLNIPVILGKLYTGVQEDYVYANINNLAVSSAVKLPNNTTFGDILSLNTLYNMMQRLQGINSFNDNYYLIGDKVTLGSFESGDISVYTTSGYISSDSTQVIVDITLPKPLDKTITTITCTKYEAKIRSVDGYLLNNEFTEYVVGRNKFIVVRANTEGSILHLTFDRSEVGQFYVWDTNPAVIAKNNTPITISGVFTFEFS